MIQLIEELSFNAWPALNTFFYDGWLLRFAKGYTHRANSINPVFPTNSSVKLTEKLSYCEQIYTNAGQDVVFKLTPDSQPQNLDLILDQRGYVYASPTSVHTLDLKQLLLQDQAGFSKIQSSPRVWENWINAYFRLTEGDFVHAGTLEQMLNLIVPLCKFVTIEQPDGKINAIGLAVLERNYLGLFSIAVDKADRKTGLGQTLVSFLLQWGKLQGATLAYLQVASDNIPALSLYRKLGFKESYQYWYRIKPF